MYKIGDSYELAFSFSQDEVVLFAEVTGDFNPIHLDREYASTTIFKKPIMHGFLGGSVFSKIIGMHFPGEGSIYLKQDLRFHLPMFSSQPYRAVVTIEELLPEKHRALMKTEVFSQSGEIVLSGMALVQHSLKL